MTVAQKPDISIVVPTFNEEARISSCLGAIERYFSESSLSYEILISDDGSTDNTLGHIKDMVSASSKIKVIKNPHKGKGAAVRAGVLSSVGDLVLFTDTDFSTPLTELKKLLEKIENSGYDIAIASRDLPGSKIVRHQSLIREMLGKALNKIIQFVYVPGISDTQCGFKLFKGDAARQLFSKLKIDGFLFDVEMLYLARVQGLKVAEVPVKWEHNKLSRVRVLRDLPQVIFDLVRIKALH
jgi:dolichyl-phosphate beta-glucosyltransferase